MTEPLSKYESLDRMGDRLIRAEAQGRTKPTSRSRPSGRKLLTTFSIVFGLLGAGAAAGAATADLAGFWEPPPQKAPPITDDKPLVAGQPGAYEATLERGLSIPVITAAGDGHGGYSYGPYDCDAHTKWFEENIAQKWLDGEYANPSEFPKPPAGICGAKARRTPAP